MSVARQVVNNWKNEMPQKYALKLLQEFGAPNYVTMSSLTWLNPHPNIQRISIVNEKIFHDSPVRHYDFVYSTANIATTPAQACMLQFISGSILVDQLKKEITARCSSLVKNQITLGFVYDYTTGRLHGSKEQLQAEYKRRIINNIPSRSNIFPLPISET
jgi:hypothetical protein